MRNARSVRKRLKRPVVLQALHRLYPRSCSPLPAVLQPVPEAVLLCLMVRANLNHLPQQKHVKKLTKMLKTAKMAPILAPDPRVRMRIHLLRLTRKLMKIHLSLVAPAKENLLAHLWVKAKQCPVVVLAVVNSRCRVAKKVEFLCARHPAFLPLPVEPLHTTMIISERCTTVLPLISNAYWIRWRKRLPVSSWRLSVFENSTTLPRIFPTETFMRVYQSELIE